DAAVQNLRAILAAAGPAAERVRIDPSLARGLSYYTGAIMEINVADLSGSLGGGGRYDNLIGMFLGRDVPATGFSLGVERIIVVMTERNMFPASVARGAVDLLVTMWQEPALRDGAMSLADELRRRGLRVAVYPDPDKLGKQLKYAADRNLPFVAIQGSDESAAGVVNIKDLRSGAQNTVRRDRAAAFILEKLGANG